jgi:hypothetical protein
LRLIEFHQHETKDKIRDRHPEALLGKWLKPEIHLNQAFQRLLSPAKQEILRVDKVMPYGEACLKGDRPYGTVQI